MQELEVQKRDGVYYSLLDFDSNFDVFLISFAHGGKCEALDLALFKTSC